MLLASAVRQGKVCGRRERDAGAVGFAWVDCGRASGTDCWLRRRRQLGKSQRGRLSAVQASGQT